MSIDYLFEDPKFGRGRPAKHPFSTMEVGDILEFDEPKMQGYAHTYGQKSGMKFQTRKHDGKVYVKRIS